MSISIERFALLEDINSSLPTQKKLLGSSELSRDKEYKEGLCDRRKCSWLCWTTPTFFLTCLFLLDFILDNIPEVFMTKILCTWLLTLEKSLFLKRPLGGWHGWPQRQGRNFIQKSKKKDMKEKAKREGKREFEYALHRPIEFTFFVLGNMRNSTEHCSGAPGSFLILSLHLRIDCFLKASTSGLSE